MIYILIAAALWIGAVHVLVGVVRRMARPDEEEIERDYQEVLRLIA